MLACTTNQYVWSLRYIDAPILRDSFDTSGNVEPSSRIYYLGDANYNVTALVNSSGTVIERYSYDPYGKVTVYDAAWTSSGSTSSVGNTILFAGESVDPETGLLYCDARYYSVTLGNFVTTDPARADINTYRYCTNDPVDETDPSGREGSQSLNFATIHEPTGNDEGGMSQSWDTRWFLSQPSKGGGLIIQRVTAWGYYVDIFGYRHRLNFPAFGYWEAWSVSPYRPLSRVSDTGQTYDDAFWISENLPCTEGKIVEQGTAAFYEGATLPPNFQVNPSSPAHGLPMTHDRNPGEFEGPTNWVNKKLVHVWNSLTWPFESTINYSPRGASSAPAVPIPIEVVGVGISDLSD